MFTDPSRLPPPANPEVPTSLALAKQLESLDDPEEIKASIGALLESIEKDAGVVISPEVNNFYNKMRRENCLGRIESLSRVLSTITQGEDLVIAENTDTHYANAVIPESAGIELAFAEGQAPGVRSMIGFGKTMIGFKTDNLEVLPVEFSQDDIRDVAERSYLCRHVTGRLKREDIRTVVMRIPKGMFPKEKMTKAEKIADFKFVFRGFEVGTPAKEEETG